MSDVPMLKHATGDAQTDHWPQLLQELVDVLAAHFARGGCDKATAENEAKAATFAIATHLGGRSVYLPFGQRLKKALMNVEIFRRANGRNTRELATEYSLTDRRIQQIVRDQTMHQKTIRKTAREANRD